ncbi:DNA recombination protein RmuC [Solitalea lacus]|uniref:DNA recombination protein RmuC n=1 Tax=Solitalea lacus TaxID=2911172 RepID=UPI001EDC23DC|nr:DNA recombination protein RmuC [Solitalea lacus]UKJ07829.1 DNA recombination protein RmuC [Solitalea lacus]
MDIISLLTGTLIGSLAAYSISIIISSKKYQKIALEKTKLEERARLLAEENSRSSAQHSEDRSRLVRELDEEREAAQQTRIELVALRENVKSQQLRVDDQKAEIQDMHKKLTIQFENIAGKLLEEKSVKFTEQNKLNLDLLLNPLKEKISDFEKKVEKTYDQELRDKISLKEEVKKLFELNQKISEEANNLARALKTDTKKQGNWGEFILERVLERSGLIKGENYTIQSHEMTLVGADGNRYIPDVIVHLPENKHLVIDSKVSLLAYEQWTNTENEEDREKFGRSHVGSIRNHIIDLSNKNYHQLNGLNAPEFVLMFVPIESSFSMAVQTDQDLFGYAWDKKVVIVSPSTLLATLRTVASVWKQEKQNRNVMEIARLSGEMYDKFVGFIGDMEQIDKNLHQSRNAFDKAVNKLSTGRGSLITTAEKVKSLGAKASKQLDAKHLDAQP